MLLTASPIKKKNVFQWFWSVVIDSGTYRRQKQVYICAAEVNIWWPRLPDMNRGGLSHCDLDLESTRVTVLMTWNFTENKWLETGLDLSAWNLDQMTWVTYLCNWIGGIDTFNNACINSVTGMVTNGNNSNQTNFAKGHFENPNTTKPGSRARLLSWWLYSPFNWL